MTGSTSGATRADRSGAAAGIVPQDAFLFKGTIRSNIAYARPDASVEEIMSACESCWSRFRHLGTRERIRSPSGRRGSKPDCGPAATHRARESVVVPTRRAGLGRGNVESRRPARRSSAGCHTRARGCNPHSDPSAQRGHAGRSRGRCRRREGGRDRPSRRIVRCRDRIRPPMAHGRARAGLLANLFRVSPWADPAPLAFLLDSLLQR